MIVPPGDLGSPPGWCLRLRSLFQHFESFSDEEGCGDRGKTPSIFYGAKSFVSLRYVCMHTRRAHAPTCKRFVRIDFSFSSICTCMVRTRDSNQDAFDALFRLGKELQQNVGLFLPRARKSIVHRSLLLKPFIRSEEEIAAKEAEVSGVTSTWVAPTETGLEHSAAIADSAAVAIGPGGAAKGAGVQRVFKTVGSYGNEGAKDSAADAPEAPPVVKVSRAYRYAGTTTCCSIQALGGSRTWSTQRLNVAFAAPVASGTITSCPCSWVGRLNRSCFEEPVSLFKLHIFLPPPLLRSTRLWISLPPLEQSCRSSRSIRVTSEQANTMVSTKGGGVETTAVATFSRLARPKTIWQEFQRTQQMLTRCPFPWSCAKGQDFIRPRARSEKARIEAAPEERYRRRWI